MSSKSLVNRFVWNDQYFEKIAKTLTFSGCPWKFYHRFMYIAPSSCHILLNLNLLFKLILRWVGVVFWCLEWECCPFWKIDGSSFKSTNTCTIVYTRGSQTFSQKGRTRLQWNLKGPELFLEGGGGANMCAKRTSRAQSAKSLAAGVQGPLKGPGSSGL